MLQLGKPCSPNLCICIENQLAQTYLNTLQASSGSFSARRCINFLDCSSMPWQSTSPKFVALQALLSSLGFQTQTIFVREGDHNARLNFESLGKENVRRGGHY